MPADGLVIDFSLLPLIESRKSQGVARCDGCDASNNLATYRCTECMVLLCDFCTNYHRRAKATADHGLETMAEYKHGNSELKLKYTPRKGSEQLSNAAHSAAYCTTHPSEPLKLFCRTCDKIICSDCFVDEHKGHEYDHLHAIVSDHRNSISRLVNDTETWKRQAEGLVLNTHQTAQKVVGARARAEAAVKTHFSDVRRALAQSEMELLKEVGDWHSDKQATLRQARAGLNGYLSTVGETLEFTRAALQQGDSKLMLLDRLVQQRLQLMLECSPDSVKLPDASMTLHIRCPASASATGGSGSSGSSSSGGGSGGGGGGSSGSGSGSKFDRLMLAVVSSVKVCDGVSAAHSSARGDGLSATRLVAGKLHSFTVTLRNTQGQLVGCDEGQVLCVRRAVCEERA
jgi:uncharacterized membrane protein YgcG